MKIEELFIENAVQRMKEIIQSKTEIVVYGVPTVPYILTGATNIEGKDFEFDGKTKVLSLPNIGGTLIMSEGDLDIGHFKLGFNNFNERFGKELLEYLSKKNIKCEWVGNDLIVDSKYKVASYSSVMYDGLLYSAFHISVNIHLDIIKKVCKKEMVKIPRGLSDYGITTEELKKLLFNFVDKE